MQQGIIANLSHNGKVSLHQVRDFDQEGQGDQIRTSYQKEYKRTGKILGGMFAETKGTGRTEPHPTVSVYGYAFGIKTADYLKQHFRRVRPQEAEVLDRIDEQVAALRAQRQIMLHKAWTNGHIITLKEVTDRAAAKR